MSLLGAQDLRAEGRRRAVRAPQAARAPRGADPRRRPRARHALGHAATSPDRRLRRGVSSSRARRWRDGRERIRALRDRCARSSVASSTRCYLNGDMEHRLPHNLNSRFNYVEGESLIMAIKDIAVSSGSACTSASLEPCYVLRALGVERRTGAQLDPLRLRPVHDRGRNRFRRSTWSSSKVKQPARAVAALRDGQGRHRPQRRSSGRRTDAHRRVTRTPWPTADKVIDHYENPRNVGTLDKDDRRSAPAWSAHRRAAT